MWRTHTCTPLPLTSSTTPTTGTCDVLAKHCYVCVQGGAGGVGAPCLYVCLAPSRLDVLKCLSYHPCSDMSPSPPLPPTVLPLSSCCALVLLTHTQHGLCISTRWAGACGSGRGSSGRHGLPTSSKAAENSRGEGSSSREEAAVTGEGVEFVFVCLSHTLSAAGILLL